MQNAFYYANEKGLPDELTHKSWTVLLGYQKGLSSVLNRA